MTRPQVFSQSPRATCVDLTHHSVRALLSVCMRPWTKYYKLVPHATAYKLAPYSPDRVYHAVDFKV